MQPDQLYTIHNLTKEPVYSDLYTEKILILRQGAGSLSNNSEAIRHSLAQDNAVGCIGGYYDDDLSLLFMSSFFMHNLGYDSDRFTKVTGGSLKPLIHCDDLRYFEDGKFREEAGADAFITKPLFRSRLTALFKGLVGSDGKKRAKEDDGISELERTDYSGRRVLLVEDNELNRESAGEIIGMTSAEVESAENGKAAVDTISEKGADYYDIVFMDIQMPLMNGYEAAREIRRLPGCGEIPIIAMTANAFAEDVLLAKNAGMNEHISKPIDMKKLGEILQKWIQ